MNIKVFNTEINDVLIFQPEEFLDHRGYLIESYNKSFYQEHLPSINFVQENESKSNFGVCRECELKFVQSRKEEWADGWRPTDKEVKKHVEEIEKRVLSILSEIDNYI